jgi:hypothetical protein
MLKINCFEGLERINTMSSQKSFNNVENFLSACVIIREEKISINKNNDRLEKETASLTIFAIRKHMKKYQKKQCLENNFF